MFYSINKICNGHWLEQYGPLNNSRNDGFEELVCQLAPRMVIVGQKRFVRIGKPDGGKECFWEWKMAICLNGKPSILLNRRMPDNGHN
jgi:hypothetical protein